MCDETPEWLGEDGLEFMIIAHWLIGQLRYQNGDLNYMIDYLQQLFGVDESPDQILNLLQQFRNEGYDVGCSINDPPYNYPAVYPRYNDDDDDDDN